MQEKVTNYEISKRLDELEFECQRHCGWWNSPKPDTYVYSDMPNTEGGSMFRMWLPIKAYDCWDLLMWLVNCKQQFHVEDFRDKTFRAVYKGHQPVQGIDNQPQNALGLIIIKILEEQNNESN